MSLYQVILYVILYEVILYVTIHLSLELWAIKHDEPAQGGELFQLCQQTDT